MNAVGKQLVARNSFVCSSHFSQEHYWEDPETGRKKLKGDAVPSNLLESFEVRGVYILHYIQK